MTAINGRNSSESDAPGPRLPALAGTDRGLRADAVRNREHVLAAAREVFVEQGADAPLDDIARRAGVGIATLYRRFPDREALLRAVALDVLTRAGGEARAAEAEEADPFGALGRYMHRALDLRISAVMPTLLGHISFDDEDVKNARENAVEPVLRLIGAAQAVGRLRADVAFGDIGVLLVRLSRPLPAPFPRELDLLLAHRHLDLLLAALEAHPESSPNGLSGPAMTLAQLQRLGGSEIDQSL